MKSKAMMNNIKMIYRNLMMNIIDNSDIIARLYLKVYLKRTFSKDILIKQMCSQAASGSIIYDVGANNGMYSIILASRVANSLIYSFEPNSDVFKRLVRFVHLMNLQDRVIPFQVALDEVSGDRTFFISSESARSSFHKFNAINNHNNITKSYTVKCYSIDDLIKNGICKAPNIIKIDTEGHEHKVISGAKNTLISYSPYIGFEPHWVENENSSTDDIIIEFLKKYSYECVKIGYPVWCYKKDRNISDKI